MDSTWISDGTRMFFAPPYHAVGGPPPAVGDWRRSTFGTRFVSGELLESDGQRELVVRLYDFNALALRRDAQMSNQDESASGWADLSSSCLPHWSSPFTEEFDTSLPYWKNVAYVRLNEIGDNEDDKWIQCAVGCCEDNIVITDFVNKEHRILVF
ncbi:hypothetical protein BJ912DRAFT_77486 [Pholiota molesta]|nr:hypothetical protein BJ912DRAFT_77486 [Pholiota molesta]